MADQESPEDGAARLLDQLRNFTGDLQRWHHPLFRKLIYTPGVRHLAERAGAHWLLDAVASWLGSEKFVAAVRQDSRVGEIHFWRLEVTARKSAVLTAVADAGEAPFIEQVIAFTDFPLAEISLYVQFDGTHWTLMLPSEY